MEKKDFKIVEDFYNKLASEIRATYFPEVKYYRDDKDCEAAHYAIELFNNGVLGYSQLIEELSVRCDESEDNIHAVVSKYIAEWGNYKWKV